jgi:hypothetical protein
MPVPKKEKKKEKGRHSISALAAMPVRREVTTAEQSVSGLAVLTLDRAAWREAACRIESTGHRPGGVRH